jgi:hypothetical protein
MIAVIGITGIKYLRMKSRGFKGDMNKRVRKDELLFLAISIPRVMVIKVSPNTVSPGTILTG